MEAYTNQIKKWPKKLSKQKYRLTIGFISAMVAIVFFYDIFFYTKEKGFLLFVQPVIPTKPYQLTYQDLFDSLERTRTQYISPARFIYHAIPHYKNKSMYLGMYNQELAGYFHIPDNEKLLALDEGNQYMPILPTPQKKVIDYDKLSDVDYLRRSIFMGGDGLLQIGSPLLDQWDFKALSQKPITLDKAIEGPKVIIFHTHSKERFKGETTNDPGILAVGEALSRLLEEKYGIETLHVTESFYPSETSESTTGAYERMEPVISSIINQYPSLQISIDIHRDGVRDKTTHLVGDYKDEKAAQIMFVNGLCQKQDETGKIIPMKMLTNDYLEENLAFSLQAQLEGMKYYPELMRKIYLKPYRYSLHMLPYSLLLEVGADTNTPEEALRSVEPIADILMKVLEKD